MELTKSEIEIAERFISKRERQLAQWPLRRWVILAIFSVFMFLGYRSVSDGMRSIHDDKAMDLQVSLAIGGDPPPGQEQRWVVGSMLKIGKVLESRYQVVTYALMEVALGYIEVLLGAIMVCLTILRWNTGERDALICKLLRAKLQELEQDAAPNSHPPSQSPASPEVPSSDAERTPPSGGFALGIVKRPSKILAAGSAIVGGLLLIILPVSYHFQPHRASVGVTSSLLIGLFDGGVWFDSRPPHYKGRISDIIEEHGGGRVPYEGGEAHASQDWAWHIGHYGIGQRTFRGGQDEFVARDIGLNLPGIYYRHFEWEKEPLLWTVMVGLWYPILFSAALSLWFIFRCRRTSTMPNTARGCVKSLAA